MKQHYTPKIRSSATTESVNKAVANQMRRPLLGCRSHRLNLAVKRYLKKHLRKVILKAARLMEKLHTLKEAGRLRAVSDLLACKRNATRWLGDLKMLLRLEQLHPTLMRHETVRE